MTKPGRVRRAQIAAETIQIFEKGSYLSPAGKQIDLREALESAKSGSVLYRPEQRIEVGDALAPDHVDSINSSADVDQAESTDIPANPDSTTNHGKATNIEVTGETTLAAVKRLLSVQGISETVCLNFASAKNPGGGFLNGSQAQEESLARASGLYPCIVQMQEMYDYNRRCSTCLYSDYMIYSPHVPVIRDDQDRLLAEPYTVSMITAPAVNAGVVLEREPHNRSNIHSTMTNRIRKIVELAAHHGNKGLVLGAYGCGVFKNRPEDVAGYFKKVLVDEGYAERFEKIVFAVYDTSRDQGNLRAFERVLGGAKHS
ncbi:TIGR02452 family protein [Brevibacillus dissolubilis]|uniref:TIGR02452 family protein n=1 Tax=Brevibacillus dissolubilis TaxID=1844116 RepID=UPI001116B26E|nr:TIGR02452 family protein [Brevibacillus dissolubilis]